jgi:hypothetical protein
MTRRINSKILFLCMFVGVSAFAAASQAADCSSNLIQFENATAIETKAACESLEKIAVYFQSLGANVSGFKIKFIFADQVLLPAEKPEDRVPAHGYFDTDDNSIHMTHFDSASQTERMPWGFLWTEEMAASFLLHEVSHLNAISFMGNSFRQLPHFWHEFLAYSIQVELMPAELKTKILQFTPDTPAFESPSAVNSFFYEVDPEKYAIRSYRSMKAWGGASFLKDLMDLKIKAARD